MRKVYLAGPINGCSDNEAHGWRDHVIAELSGLYTFLNPMDRDYRNINDNHRACKDAAHEVCEGDKNDIRSCSIFLAVMPKPCLGTAMELFFAWHATCLPLCLVVVPPEPHPLSPWVVEHCHALFYGTEQVIHYLKETA